MRPQYLIFLLIRLISFCWPIIALTAVIYAEGRRVDTVARATGKLGSDLLKVIAKDEDNDNIVISPLSIQIPLHIVLQGADPHGPTFEEIQRYFEYRVAFKSSKDVHEPMQALIKSLGLESGKETIVSDNEQNTRRAKAPTKLSIANALVTRKDITLQTKFKDTVEQYYNIKMGSFDSSVPRSIPELAKRINDWASDNTDGAIKGLINEGDLSADIVSILINAVHLKGEWMYPFDGAGSRTFYKHGKKGQAIKTPFMHNTRYFKYLDLRQETAESLPDAERQKNWLYYSLDCQIVSIPIDQNGLSMMILLPGELDGLSKLYDIRITRIIDRMNQSGNNTKLNLRLPKFAFDVEYDVKDYLEQLGMRKLLSRKPELTKMFDKPDIAIDSIKHKAKINVTEQGVEASAVTAMSISLLSMPVGPVVTPIQFVVDHPFMFAIVHKRHNVPLFMGQVVTF